MSVGSPELIAGVGSDHDLTDFAGVVPVVRI